MYSHPVSFNFSFSGNVSLKPDLSTKGQGTKQCVIDYIKSHVSLDRMHLVIHTTCECGKFVWSNRHWLMLCLCLQKWLVSLKSSLIIFFLGILALFTMWPPPLTLMQSLNRMSMQRRIWLCGIGCCRDVFVRAAERAVCGTGGWSLW